MSEPFDDCWFLTGATATGKTGVALELARRLDAEIVSLDSMTIYRGMDIGTAKPAPAERAAVPHHLLDIVEPADEYSVAQYVEDAAATVASPSSSRDCAPSDPATARSAPKAKHSRFEGRPRMRPPILHESHVGVARFRPGVTSSAMSPA